MNMIYSSKDRSLCVISFDTKVLTGTTISYMQPKSGPQNRKIPYGEIQKTAVIDES